ncbi:hypothetical protein ACFLQQ_03620, partial [Actinomycetota bacterium]
MTEFNTKINNYFLSKIKLILTTSLLILVLAIIPTSTIFAHSPVFTEENHDPSYAYQISDFTKSWVIYATLDHPDEGAYYKFTASKGDRIYISLMTSENPTTSGYLPSFALLTPGSVSKDTLPSYIEVPEGLGAILVDGKEPDKASYEPFTPGWLYDIATISIDAPEDGTYYIVVFDSSQKTGNYSLAVGYIESFTITEWIMIPYYIHETYAWEGQNIFVTYLPIILTIIIGSIIFLWQKKRTKEPRGISKWLAAFAGLTFLGTTLSIFYQIILAISITGFFSAVIITIIIASIGLVLSFLTLLYAFKKKQTLTSGKRI